MIGQTLANFDAVRNKAVEIDKKIYDISKDQGSSSRKYGNYANYGQYANNFNSKLRNKAKIKSIEASTDKGKGKQANGNVNVTQGSHKGNNNNQKYRQLSKEERE
ncbi:hypothetical protein FRC03_003883 [Tulasnella sp. 419]|nr:hypothetical protein FRC03_003883 [Tulasnella sp. 419]